MLGFSLARLVGIVVALPATLWLVVQLSDRDWPGAALALCVLVAGLSLAFWGDHRMDRAKQQREMRQQREGEAYQGFELDVGLRWFKWVALTLILGGVATLLLWWMVPNFWWAGQHGMALAIGVLGLLVGASFLGLLSLGLQASQRKPLVHIGPLGIQVWSLPLLPWSQVQGADLQEITIKGQTQWLLMLAIDPAYAASLPQRWRLVCSLWPMVRRSPQKNVIGVAHTFLNENPHTVLQAVRTIGKRQGASLVEGWRHFQTIEEAREARRLQLDAEEAMRDVDRSLDELRRMSAGADLDPARLAAMNKRVSAELERMQSTSSTSLAHLKTRSDKNLRQLRSAMRGLWIAFGLFMVWVIVRIVLALTG